VKYTEGVNRLIAGRIAEIGPDKVLDIACGTGRRALAVRELTGLSYSIDGIDISASMVEQARERGVEARIGNWGDCSVDRGDYDAITLMYAFGHFSSRAERKRAISQVFACLKAGGLFIFDAFNVEDPDEWGPAASQMYDSLDLGEHGYERGDVFYRKHTGDGVAFLHYCEASELNTLLTEVGFILESVQHIGYGKNTGEVVEDGGKLLLFARRPD
jgi:SAM-dependent methyltransferase